MSQWSDEQKMRAAGMCKHGRSADCDECFLEATLDDTITREAANDAKVIGALTSALHQAQSERDRYREALTEIARGSDEPVLSPLTMWLLAGDTLAGAERDDPAFDESEASA